MRRLTVFLVLGPLLVVGCAPEAPIACCVIPPMAASVYFGHGDAGLNETSQREIRAVARYLIARPEKSIVVVGHNDLSGGAEADPGISRRRAEAVAAALIAQDVPREKVSVVSRGGSEPRVAAGRGEKSPQNRRVDLNGD